jgi:hypothetical protein
LQPDAWHVNANDSLRISAAPRLSAVIGAVLAHIMNG